MRSGWGRPSGKPGARLVFAPNFQSPLGAAFSEQVTGRAAQASWWLIEKELKFPSPDRHPPPSSLPPPRTSCVTPGASPSPPD